MFIESIQSSKSLQYEKHSQKSELAITEDNLSQKSFISPKKALNDPKSPNFQNLKFSSEKINFSLTEQNFLKNTKNSFKSSNKALNGLKTQNLEFSYEKKIRIFELHQKYGNHWKMISSHFKNRSDNFIKNQFFSLIRKSLRNARKILGLYSNTDHINKMLPKVLTLFVKKQIILELPLGLGRNFRKTKIKVKIFEFVKKYASDKICYDKIREIDLFIIKECLQYLDDVNEKYVLTKNKKIKKKKKFNFFKFSFKRFENKDDFENKKNFLELKNKKNYLLKIYNEILLKENFDEDIKKKMIEILYELGEIHLQLGKIVENTNEKKYYSFFKKKNEKFISVQNIKKTNFVNKKKIIIKNSKIDNKIINKKIINQKISEEKKEIFKNDFETFKYKKLHELFNLGNANENQTLQIPSQTRYIKLCSFN